jgi:molybdopterin synthase sulfur carrier subunit
MSVKIVIPAPMRQYTENLEAVEVAGKNVRDVLLELAKKYPAIQKKILTDDGKKQQFVNLFLNNEDIRYLENVDTVVKDGDELSIIPAVAGG